MAEGRIRLQPPMGGLNEQGGYQDQPPYTSPDLLNVWPRDTIRFRNRIGSRPGSLRHYLTGYSENVWFIDSVDVSDETLRRNKFDSFDGASLSSNIWTPLSGGTLPEVVAGKATATYNAGSVTRSAMYSLPSDYDTTYPGSTTTLGYYKTEVGIFIAPYKGRHWGKYRIYLLCNDTTPDPTTDGIICELDLTGTSTASGAATEYVGGADTVNTFSTIPSYTNGNAGWFSAVLFEDTQGDAGLDKLICLWNGVAISSTITIATKASHNTFGFGMVAEDTGTIDGETVDGRTQVTRFRVSYIGSENRNVVSTRFLLNSSNAAADPQNTSAMSASDGPVIASAVQGDTGTESLSNQHPTETAEFLQNLYIADYGDVVASGTDGAFGATTGVFTSATYTNWSADVPILDIYNYSIRIEGWGDFSINSVPAGTDLGYIETWGEPSSNTTGLTFRIFRSPKRYVSNSEANTLSRWRANTDKGLIPCNCKLVARWSERVVLAGDPENPNIWYMCRQGDVHDWDFAADDAAGNGGGAVGSTSAGQGTIGEPITALIPATDDTLLFGCTRSLWQLSGDPGFGGQYDNLSREIGVVGARAWTQTPDGVIVFMSQDGLYATGPSSKPSQISRNTIPQRLLDLDSDQFYVTLQYDLRYKGIWIFVTNKDEVPTTHYWMDWESKTFWPFSFDSTDLDPISVKYYKSQNYEDQRTYFGGRDGKIRVFHLLAPDDDGNDLLDNTYVDMGPISVGGMERDGVVTEITGALDSESGEVDWSIKPGDTPEQAIEATAQETGEWTAGQNTVEHPRVGAEAVVIRLAGGSTNRRWAVERMSMEIRPQGRQRL